MSWKPIAFLAAAGLLAGCTGPTAYVPYQSAGLLRGSLGDTQGYSDAKLGDGRFVVAFQGNGLTSQDRVRTLLLYRCAELTRQQGGDSFAILRDHPGTSDRAQAYPYDAAAPQAAPATYLPADAIPIRALHGEVVIQTFKADSQPETGYVYRADALMTDLTAKLDDPE